MSKKLNCQIRNLQEAELSQADYIFRLAFGTFIKLPDPLKFAGNSQYMHRWYVDPTAVFAATLEEQLIGTNFAINWGSYGFFGPLSVHPDYWQQGVATQLMEATMAKFASWGTKHIGFFTFSNSQKHLWFYGKFGFSPRFLTTILIKYVVNTQQVLQALRYSQLTLEQQAEAILATIQLTNEVYEGLDLSREIRSVQEQGLGETLLLWDEKELISFAVCHYGAGSEAEHQSCYVKFGAVRPGNKSGENFAQLITELEVFTVKTGLFSLMAGVNTACDKAYNCLLGRGFRVAIIGLAMHLPNEPAYNHSDSYVINDCR